MGHSSPEASAPAPLLCAPTLIMAPIPSPPRSGRLLPVAGGDIDDDPIDTVLSEGAKGLAARGVDADGGGASPLPLPRMRPPPSLRPDMVAWDGMLKPPSLDVSWSMKLVVNHPFDETRKNCRLWTRRPELVELRLELRRGLREAVVVGPWEGRGQWQWRLDRHMPAKSAHGRATSEARSLEAPRAPGLVEGVAQADEIRVYFLVHWLTVSDLVPLYRAGH